MMRRGLLNMDDFAPLNDAGSSRHSGFATTGQHNPIYDRVLATDYAALEHGMNPQMGESTLQFHGVDYLIF